ncbi:MAG TPA: hypothetical protein VGJ49_09705 [Gaiellaceae bacterium]
MPLARREDMYANPHAHLEIARQRQADLVRSAEQHRLAKLVAEKRPGPFARLQAYFSKRHDVATQPVARPV